MHAAVAVVIAAGAGAGLVLQSLVLVAVSQRVGLPTALLLNTLVGLALIVAVILAGDAAAMSGSVFRSWRWWFLVPGLLGTGFVAANVAAVARIGTVATASLVIAAQLGAAALADMLGAAGVSHPLTPLRLVGLVMIAGGAVCALRS